MSGGQCELKAGRSCQARKAAGTVKKKKKEKRKEKKKKSGRTMAWEWELRRCFMKE